MTDTKDLQFSLSFNEARSMVEVLQYASSIVNYPRKEQALYSFNLIEMQLSGVSIEAARDAIERHKLEEKATNEKFEALRKAKEDAWLALPWYTRLLTARTNKRPIQ